mmetsp:Transcript_11146/g.29010  ORF Transcript_11146/g.29010 Transcript_11146/m.29010 type:complete len:89 (-) Transcript_11146:97-363(-)
MAVGYVSCGRARRDMRMSALPIRTRAMDNWSRHLHFPRASASYHRESASHHSMHTLQKPMLHTRACSESPSMLQVHDLRQVELQKPSE